MKKSTDDLLKEMKTNKLKTMKDYERYRQKNTESFNNTYMRLDRALMSIIESKKLKKSTVIKRAGIAQSYGYQILDGRKQNPDRDKVIMMCIGMELSHEDTIEMEFKPLLLVKDNFPKYTLSTDEFDISRGNKTLNILDFLLGDEI